MGEKRFWQKTGWAIQIKSTGALMLTKDDSGVEIFESRDQARYHCAREISRVVKVRVTVEVLDGK